MTKKNVMNRFIKKLIITLLLFVSIINSFSLELSKKAQISIITCVPGSELYTAFGHSAIRVNDPLQDIDFVYNYGTFSFNTPNFYLKFIRGDLNYMLSVSDYKRFMRVYEHENRNVKEQVLNLTQIQKQKLFDVLEKNKLPENKYYLYDFIFDNCATRIRDVFKKALNNDIQFSDSTLRDISFREILESYLTESKWSRFGINLVLGSLIDKTATASEYMFIPDYLMNAFSNAQIKNNSTNSKIVYKINILNEANDTLKESLGVLNPLLVFWAIFLFVVVLSIIEYSSKIQYHYIDGIWFLIIGILGTLMCFLWFGTKHTVVVDNWNIAWAVPTHLIFSFFLFRKKISNLTSIYFLISGSVALILLMSWQLIPQQFDIAFVPIILITAIRSIKIYLYKHI